MGFPRGDIRPQAKRRAVVELISISFSACFKPQLVGHAWCQIGHGAQDFPVERRFLVI